MDKLNVAIIGGGASGLFLGSLINVKNVAIFERGDRVGKKLSATGNGQGNVSNLSCKEEGYFSFSARGKHLAQTHVTAYDMQDLKAFFEGLGVLLTADERGRVYPASKQASALTDALRFHVQRKGVKTYLNTKVISVEKENGLFRLQTEQGDFYAENVVLCTGGKSAKNFGTDGFSYALAEKFSHTLTPLYPALVQLKTETKNIKTLKGIRVSPARVRASWRENGKESSIEKEGDILFTEYGVSGDVIFHLSAFFTDKIEKGVSLSINFLPQFEAEEIYNVLEKKSGTQKELPFSELLCGIVNNQVGRAIAKTVPEGDLHALVKGTQNFSLAVTGSLGFDYAQVTKGGIDANEVEDTLESKYEKGLYFAGEILDIDGKCGGYNLAWAYASAKAVAKAIEKKYKGQV